MKRYVPGSTKQFTGGAIGNVLWTEAEIPYGGAALKGLYVALTGTNYTLANITRIQVFAGEKPIWRVNQEQLAQYLSTLGKRALAASTDTSFAILFDFANANCSAPALQAIKVQIDHNATPAGACTAQINYILGDAPSVCFTQLIASAMNIAASQSTPVSYPITVAGVLRGILVPDVADVTSLRLWVGEKLMMDFPSSAALLKAQDYYSGVATTTGQKMLILDGPGMPVEAGTRVELTTAAGFGGVTEELTVWTENPHPVAA